MAARFAHCALYMLGVALADALGAPAFAAHDAGVAVGALVGAALVLALKLGFAALRKAA